MTVVVPIFRGVDAVRRCLESLRRFPGPPGTEHLLVDDASPEVEMAPLLARAEAGPWPVPLTVLRNDRNRGFVASVNRAIGQCSGDVVVLNADTVVTDGWLERLADAARGRPGVATVTPLSNFGSICTLPSGLREAFDLDGTDPRIDDCARFVEQHSLGSRPQVITGVGFCLYMTREVLDACGVLDERTFGVGYGEEVDFCLRASQQGFVHLVEDSTFVYHEGAVSFGQERPARLAASSRAIHARYPWFREANLREREDDPLAVAFAALELALAERRRDRPHVVQVLHSGPGALGGTEKHLSALMDELEGDVDFSLLHPVDHGFVLRTRWAPSGSGLEPPLEYEFLVPASRRRATGVVDEGAAAAFTLLVSIHDVDAVHLQNLIGHSLAPLREVASFEGAVLCSVRDLYLACPHHWLLYRNEAACGIPEDRSYCERCLPETRSLSVEFQSEFRDAARELLSNVDLWVFASRSAADHLARVYRLDEARTAIIEHGSIVPLVPALREPDEAVLHDEPLRLGFVGLGWAKKGLDIVNRLADEIAPEGIELHHFGTLEGSASPNLRCHGPYENRWLPALLRQSGIQVVLLPGHYAETYGHVMTEALAAGLPVIGASYGALGERIRQHGAGWTVDPADEQGVRALIARLDGCRLEVARAARAAATSQPGSVTDAAPRYFERYTASRRSGGGARGDDLAEELRRHLRAACAVAARRGERRLRWPSSPEEQAPFPVDARLARAPDGAIHLLTGRRRRCVASPLLVAALALRIGPARPIGDRALRAFEPAEPPKLVERSPRGLDLEVDGVRVGVEELARAIFPAAHLHEGSVARGRLEAEALRWGRRLKRRLPPRALRALRRARRRLA